MTLYLQSPKNTLNPMGIYLYLIHKMCLKTAPLIIDEFVKQKSNAQRLAGVEPDII